jgi:hypothetical protein
MMTDWQPMETAKRDGTSVIAAIPVYSCAGRFLGWQIDVIYCHDETGEIHSECERGWEWDDYEVWQPCPAPPSTVPLHYSQTEKTDEA